MTQLIIGPSVKIGLKESQPSKGHLHCLWGAKTEVLLHGFAPRPHIQGAVGLYKTKYQIKIRCIIR